jgi:tetratricopeptide (TPR) repeat protein
VRLAQKLRPAAEAAFRKAIEADENYVAPYSPLAQLLLLRGDMDELYELSAKGLELNPYDADLKYARAVSALRLKDYEDAAFYAQRIVDTDDAAFFPDALFILAGAVKAQGDYERAARLYGEYFAKRSNSRQLRSVAGRELTEARLAEYTLRSMQPALP